MKLYRVLFYAAAAASTVVIGTTLFSRERIYVRGWAKTWRKIEEYWDLKELYGSDFYEKIPSDEQDRIRARYYVLVDEVGKYADQCHLRDDSDLAKKHFVRQMMNFRMGGKTNMWHMGDWAGDRRPMWSPRVRGV